MRATAYKGLACLALRGNFVEMRAAAYKGLACLALRGVALGFRRAVKTDAWGFVAFCGRCCANHPWQYLRTMLSFGPILLNLRLSSVISAFKKVQIHHRTAALP